MTDKTKNQLENYLNLGFSLLPVKRNGDSVMPAFTGWQKEKKITKNNLSSYSSTEDWGLVCGRLSGNLEIIDFDEKYQKGIFKKWYDALPDRAKFLVKTLPISKTKHGGYHVLYRCKNIEGNKPLARIQSQDGPRPIIETRGEGGFTFEEPSNGYSWGKSNNIDKIKEIAPFDRDIFFNTAKLFDEIKEEGNNISKHDPATTQDIFDEFNQNNTWEDILTPLGWKKSGQKGEEVFWTRPGKECKGLSATENYKGLGLLHIFTSSTDFDPDKSYTKFGAFTYLKYGKNTPETRKMARRDLINMGYGKRDVKINKPLQEQIISEKKEDGNLVFIQSSTVKPRPIDWLWEGKFAKGKISLIAGDPGLGKSQISVDVASIVSKGGQFPLGNKAKAGKVLMFSSEDGVEDTIVPRLTAAGADLNNVYIFSTVKKEDGKEKYFDLESDLPLLEKALQAEKDISLVTIDPISAFLGTTDSHIDAEVRSLLSRLAKLAEKYNLSVLAVSHLNKGGSGNPINKVMGSLAFVAAVRSAFMIIKDEEKPERRIMTPIKNNIAKDKSGLAFSLEEVDLGADIVTSRVLWEKEPIEMSAKEIMNQQAQLNKDVGNHVVEWLESYLKNHPEGLTTEELENAAARNNISSRTLRRAAQIAMVEKYTIGSKNKKLWKYASFDSDDINPDKIPI